MPVRMRAQLTFWACFWAGYALSLTLPRMSSPSKEIPDAVSSQ
jgi:hypothetical protein